MGGKKKESAAAKKEGGDDSTERLFKSYRRHLNEYGLVMPRKLEETFLEIRDEKNPGRLGELILWEEVGPSGVRAIMDALRETEYPHIKSIRCWKTGSEDEGLRAIAQFMMSQPIITLLEMIKCDISPLGCEFLGQCLDVAAPSALTNLRLDYNPLGDEGLANLVRDLRMNKTLTDLSLAFCELTEEASRPLIELLINQNSGIERLTLQGNGLRHAGVSAVFHAMQVNNSVKVLDLSDNQFSDQPEVLQKFYDMVSNNTTLVSLDMKYNAFYDDGITAICEMFRGGPKGPLSCALTELIISETKVTPELMTELDKAITASSKRGKKGKKGKKRK